jgi:sirohydrochlorin ferrochelatase
LDPLLLFAALIMVAVLLTVLLWGAPRAAGATAPAHDASSAPEAGFLVVAPDRGFLGNEEIRDAFGALTAERNAELVFVTDARTRESLAQALAALKKRGARRAVALPFFLSTSDPRYVLANGLLAGDQARALPLPVAPGRAFGESYLAVEALADRFRAVANPAGRRVVVMGYGARDPVGREQLEADAQRLADLAAEGFGFEKVTALVWYDRAADDPAARRQEIVQALASAAEGGARPVVVPFHLGRKFDSMMSFEAELRRVLPAGAELLADASAAEAPFATWLRREANRHVPPKPGEIGVVLLAHGADFHWNETMRQAVKPLEARYKIEYAFSMADPPTLERAVRRLERRGARAIVIVRVFALTDSFERDIERMFGLDIEASRKATAHNAHAGHAMHGHDDHGHGAGVPMRIRTAAVVQSRGGLDDHPLFARALLARAQALSTDPARETVILTAHGANSDARNARWLEVLESLAGRMRAQAGQKFRAIKFATWREDWPAKRAPWIARVRQMVEEAGRDGGRALVIPARTNAQGPERKFLEGLDYALGEGFAPHPLFARWFEEQIAAGRAALAAAPDASGAPATVPPAAQAGARGAASDGRGSR